MAAGIPADVVGRASYLVTARGNGEDALATLETRKYDLPLAA